MKKSVACNENACNVLAILSIVVNANAFNMRNRKTLEYAHYHGFAYG